jgi:hypothetical protein
VVCCAALTASNCGDRRRNRQASRAGGGDAFECDAPGDQAVRDGVGYADHGHLIARIAPRPIQCETVGANDTGGQTSGDGEWRGAGQAHGKWPHARSSGAGKRPSPGRQSCDCAAVCVIDFGEQFAACAGAGGSVQRDGPPIERDARAGWDGTFDGGDC